MGYHPLPSFLSAAMPRAISPDYSGLNSPHYVGYNSPHLSHRHPPCTVSEREMSMMLTLVYLGPSDTVVRQPPVREATSLQPEWNDDTAYSNQTKRRRVGPTDLSLHNRTIDLNEVYIPRKVITCLEGGMQRYIPLTLLTTKACCNASYTAAMDKGAKHSIKLEDGGLQVSPTSFDATGENQISNSDWTDASA
jgi:hypothetical protein